MERLGNTGKGTVMEKLEIWPCFICQKCDKNSRKYIYKLKLGNFQLKMIFKNVSLLIGTNKHGILLNFCLIVKCGSFLEGMLPSNAKVMFTSEHEYLDKIK